MFQVCLPPFPGRTSKMICFSEIINFEVSITSLLLGETSLYHFLISTVCCNWEKRGRYCSVSLSHPLWWWCFLVTVSLLTSGRPPGVNKGWTSLDLCQELMHDLCPLSRQRESLPDKLHQNGPQWDSREGGSVGTWRTSPSRGVNPRPKVHFHIWSSQITIF